METNYERQDTANSVVWYQFSNAHTVSLVIMLQNNLPTYSRRKMLYV